MEESFVTERYDLTLGRLQEILREETTKGKYRDYFRKTAAFLLQLCLVWVIGNIPTMILLAIYFACQGKQRRDKQSG